MALFNRHVVKAVIKAEDTGRYFIIRSTIPLMPGWSLVGGGMNKAETTIDAMYREIAEELRVGRSAFVSVEKRDGQYTSHHYFFGIPVNMHTYVYDAIVAREDTFTPKTNWEVAESRWVPKETMLKLLGEHYIKLAKHKSQ